MSPCCGPSRGIEFHNSGRCELWHRSIESFRVSNAGGRAPGVGPKWRGTKNNMDIEKPWRKTEYLPWFSNIWYELLWCFMIASILWPGNSRTKWWFTFYHLIWDVFCSNVVRETWWSREKSMRFEHDKWWFTWQTLRPWRGNFDEKLRKNEDLVIFQYVLLQCSVTHLAGFFVPYIGVVGTKQLVRWSSGVSDSHNSRGMGFCSATMRIFHWILLKQPKATKTYWC